MLKKWLLVLFSCTLIPIAVAGGAASNHFPAQLKLDGQTLILNGNGRHKMAFYEIYHAGLYIPTRASTASDVFAQNGPKRARLLMLDAVSARTFVLVIRNGLVANTPQDKIDRHYDRIVSFFATMEKLEHLVEGDLVDLDFSAGQTIIRRNGRVFAKNLGNREFYDMIINIWIGKKPLSRKLRRALLGTEKNESSH